MKIYVKHEGSEGELMFPSFRDFQAMYRMKFVAPEDLVRRENSKHWIKAADLPELRAMHLYNRNGTNRHLTNAVWLGVGLLAVGVMVQMLLVAIR